MWDLLGGLGSSAGGFGLNFASMLLSAEVQRDLRRTAYQDQMHSMKEAGLNPILAYGGGAGAGQGNVRMDAPEDPVSSANELASGRQKRKLEAAQVTTAQETARKAGAEADTAEYLRDSQRRALDAQADRSYAGSYRDRAAAGLDRARIEAELPRAERDRLIASAGRDSASAREIMRRLPVIDRDSEAARIEEEYLRNPVGRGLRVLSLGAGDIGDVVGGAIVGGAVAKGAKALRRAVPRPKRETRTSARGVVPPLERSPARGYSRQGNALGTWIQDPRTKKWDRVDLRTGEVYESGLSSPGHYGPKGR